MSTGKASPSADVIVAAVQALESQIRALTLAALRGGLDPDLITDALNATTNPAQMSLEGREVRARYMERYRALVEAAAQERAEHLPSGGTA